MNNIDQLESRERQLSGDDSCAKRLVSSKSLDELSYKALADTPVARTKSVDDRKLANVLVMMEEVSPVQTSLIDGDPDAFWRIPLTSFTSKKQGTTVDGKKLPKCVRRYYKKQNELIEAFEGFRVESDGVATISHTNRAVMKQSAILAKVSFAVNLMLLIGKSVAAGLSGSLAVITSVIDSAVDLVSGVLMWWSNRAMKHRDPYRYPQGRTKLEPIAIIILSVIMALASVQMIIQALQKIIAFAMYDLKPSYLHNDSVVFCVNISDMRQYVNPDGENGPVFETESIVICVATVVIKLILYFICRRIASSSAQALAQDHRNDVISNTGALICGLIGYRLWKYADPIGAIVISIYIIVSWIMMGQEQIKMLTGHTARPDFLQKLTFIALNHHPKVTHIDTVRAFHFGPNFLVEVDIVLPEEMNLREAHNIGEALQSKLEKLEEVERAFVHLDFEREHHPSSEHKVV